jgi:hypothetical protein
VVYLSKRGRSQKVATARYRLCPADNQWSMSESERTPTHSSATLSILTVCPNRSNNLSADKVDKRELSEDEKKTQEYDQLAFRLVSYGAIPVLAGYTVYSCTSPKLSSRCRHQLMRSNVRDSPRMVLFHRHHSRSGNLHVWFRPARTPVDYQLQVEECRSYANEGDDV